MNNFDGKNILITGGSGFVGTHLIQRLLEQGGNVFVTDKYKSIFLENRPEVKFYQIDITNYRDVQLIVEEARPQMIFHLAAIVTAKRDFNLLDEMIEVNLRGTTNLLRAIEGIAEMECLVNFGSCEEYGNQGVDIDEAMREEPASPYAILKLATTRFCNMFSQMYNIPIVTIRPANLFGPGQARDKFIPYAILKCLNNEDIDMTQGEQKRNFLFIEDFIDALLLVAAKERRLAQIYNLGSEINVTLRSAVEMVKAMTRSQSQVNFGAVNYRENEMMVFEININKIRELGWSPKYNLEMGLNKTIEFYQSLGEDLRK